MLSIRSWGDFDCEWKAAASPQFVVAITRQSPRAISVSKLCDPANIRVWQISSTEVRISRLHKYVCHQIEKL